MADRLAPRHRRTTLLAAASLTAGLVAALNVPASGVAAVKPEAVSAAAPTSTFFSTARIEEAQSAPSDSDGDLWPSCWADDDNLYAANGDGKGFSLDQPFADIAVSQIRGTPPDLSGQTLARGDQLGSIWSGAGYNRKPTGMLCVNGAIYLAVQDLALDFNDVPAATILRSDDHGRTWSWDRRAPMFDNHVFTTIWFADFGKDSQWAPDDYVYAYGLDNNWRDSFDDTVADPTDLYLARVDRDKIQDRKAWQFFTGVDKDKPTWSRNIADRYPVLHDERRVYQQLYSSNIGNMSVLSQGGVTYNRALDRYIYTSWTEYTFEFYESPTPWGPWQPFLSKDFGGYPWSAGKHGGYATTIPSKFISGDGRTMWVQSNVCPCGGGGFTGAYRYSLRKLQVTPATPSEPANQPDASINLAAPETGAVPISKSTHFGRLDILNDGDTTVSEDDYDDEVKSASWWGYTWPRRYHLNRVDFTSGQVFDDGGWFTARPRVQLRQNGQWVDAPAQTISPNYPGDRTAGAFTTYTISFKPAVADGVRVIGFPGGARTFTSVSELAASYRTQVVDGGFEAPGGGTSAWDFEGAAYHGVDRNLGFAHSGQNNAWIRTSGTGWSAISQAVPVVPGRTYTFASWVRSSSALTDGRFGVRLGPDGSEVLGESRFGATADYTERSVQVTVPAGVTSLTVYAGFVAPGTDTWIQIDDVTIS
ncbi:carbohydrate binding domain-containing protein [Micromonospora sp. NPDC048930]|uniref:carbohydrate binding domain-containing protein n=1 Tax=Micromonospora sp. NPDC048930 TaxID=3364261 RepID=UPI0037146FA5